MPEEKHHGQSEADGGASERPASLPRRALSWAQHAWRPAATVVATALALLLTAHVINGAHGLQVWRQKRAEDQQLRKDIDKLEDENARLRNRIDKLKNDPEAIEHEAREKLHYAKPGEVIYTLPAPVQNQQQPSPSK